MEYVPMIYSFTESRFYLMVAGVLMTLFVLMLVLEGVCIEDTVVSDVRYYGLQLFKKK